MADESECVICLAPVTNPVRLTCECSLRACASCLFQWCHSNAKAPACPTCRSTGVHILALERSADGNALNIQRVAASGDVALTRLMMASGVEWWNADDRGLSVLGAASAAGALHCVKLFVEEWGVDVNAPNRNGATALLLACDGGHDAVVSYLLAAGADATIADADGHTPLMKACACGNVSCVRALLESDAESAEFGHIHADELGRTAWHFAVRSNAKHSIDVTRLLFDHPSNAVLPSLRFGDDESVFESSMRNFRISCYLLETFKTKCFSPENLQEEVQKALAIACRHSNFAVARVLIECFGADPSVSQHSDGNDMAITSCEFFMPSSGDDAAEALCNFLEFLNLTTLPLAKSGAANGSSLVLLDAVAHLPVASYLADVVGLDFNAVDVKGHSPLYFAIAAGRRDTAEFIESLLTEAQCAEQYARITLAGETLLHAAVLSRSEALVAHVLSRIPRAHINRRNSLGETPLFTYACCPHTSTPILKLLLDAGANPLVCDSSKTPLVAVLAGSSLDVDAVPKLEMIIKTSDKKALLLDQLLNQEDSDGQSGFMLACLRVGARKTSLLSQQTSTSDDNISLSVVKFIMGCEDFKASSILRGDVLGNTVLHHAAASGDAALLRLVVRALKGEGQGANFPRNHDGDTPIHSAAEAGQFHAAVFLNDAFPYTSFITNHSHKSAIDLATEAGHLKLANALQGL